MKILIVDDNNDISNLFSEFFTLNDHECISVNEGSKAVEIIMNERFDRIILDLAMPGFTGYEVLQEISKRKNIEFLGIIVLTATDISKEEENKLIKMGVNRVLKKPISLHKINEVILN